MVKVELRGVAKVTAKGRTYYYAWRGGPRLTGEPGSQEFLASYNEANADRDTSVPRALHATRVVPITPTSRSRRARIGHPGWIVLRTILVSFGLFNSTGLRRLDQ
jgi:hypothetical protein